MEELTQDEIDLALNNDLFIDTNIAKNFSNPVDPEYKRLILWLLSKKGSWVVSKKLLVEYGRSNQAIFTLTDTLNRQGRLKIIENDKHKSLLFNKLTERRLTCNEEDRWHLKTILLSSRKMAIIIDSALREDVNGHPIYEGVKPIAVSRPEAIDYENGTA